MTDCATVQTGTTFPDLTVGAAELLRVPIIRSVALHFGVAKALLDSVTGNAFADDHQVARLLVERRVGDREGIYMRVEAMD